MTEEKREALSIEFAGGAFRADMIGGASFRDALAEVQAKVDSLNPTAGASLASVLKEKSGGIFSKQLEAGLSAGLTLGMLMGASASAASAKIETPAPSSAKPAPVAESKSKAEQYAALQATNPRAAGEFFAANREKILGGE